MFTLRVRKFYKILNKPDNVKVLSFLIILLLIMILLQIRLFFSECHACRYITRALSESSSNQSIQYVKMHGEGT
jgi:hypothetical protein